MSATTSGRYYVRSKNAGPFWLTIDFFCDDDAAYRQLLKDPRLSAGWIANLLRADAGNVKIFKLERLNVVKISLPRPVIAGAIADRDIHGAQWACLITEALENESTPDSVVSSLQE
jgi:Domain of unknown function (DUF4387)